MVASAVNVALHALRAPVYYSTSAAVRIPLHADVRTELKTAVTVPATYVHSLTSQTHFHKK